MAGNNPGFIGQCEQPRVDGIDDLVVITAGQIGAANAPGKERVASYQQLHRSKMKAYRPVGMSGCVDDARWNIFEADDLSIDQSSVGGRHLWRMHSEPGRLRIHDVELGQVSLVHVDGRTGEPLQLERPAYVVDVSVGNEDLLQGEALLE